MRIITKRTLEAFAGSHADSAYALKTWVSEVRAAEWASLNDIKAAYPSASILGNSRVCFNIKGNTYRLIVAVFIPSQIVLIKFIGTHAEYAKVDAETVEPF